MHGAKTRHDGIEDAFEDLVAVGIEDRVVGHQVADVAHEEQAAPRQGQFAPVRGGIRPVTHQRAVDGLAAFLKRLLEPAGHQAQPIAIDEGLVLGVHGGHGVFAVLDRGDRGLEQHILDARRMGRAHFVRPVDLDLDMQSVVAQQHGGGLAGSFTDKADELPGIRQTHGAILSGGAKHEGPAVGFHLVARDIRVGCSAEGNDGVQFPRGLFDDQFAARRVVARPLLPSRGLGNDVGAVEGIVEAAPARVRGIQRESSVHHRYDKLRPRRSGDFGINVRGCDLEVAALRHQIADLCEERLVGFRVVALAAPFEMPGIDLRLEFVALGEQRAVLGGQVPDDGAEPGPERLAVDARPG